MNCAFFRCNRHPSQTYHQHQTWMKNIWYSQYHRIIPCHHPHMKRLQCVQLLFLCQLNKSQSVNFSSNLQHCSCIPDRNIFQDSGIIIVIKCFAGCKIHTKLIFRIRAGEAFKVPRPSATHSLPSPTPAWNGPFSGRCKVVRCFTCNQHTAPFSFITYCMGTIKVICFSCKTIWQVEVPLANILPPSLYGETCRRISSSSRTAFNYCSRIYSSVLPLGT